MRNFQFKIVSGSFLLPFSVPFNVFFAIFFAFYFSTSKKAKAFHYFISYSFDSLSSKAHKPGTIYKFHLSKCWFQMEIALNEQ